MHAYTFAYASPWERVHAPAQAFISACAGRRARNCAEACSSVQKRAQAYSSVLKRAQACARMLAWAVRWLLVRARHHAHARECMRACIAHARAHALRMHYANRKVDISADVDSDMSADVDLDQLLSAKDD
eukprot:526570-Pleurochrysis_carterae.AAC.1